MQPLDEDELLEHKPGLIPGNDDFIKMLHADPRDWQTRMVYADWLQDHRHHDHAWYQKMMARRVRNAPDKPIPPGLKVLQPDDIEHNSTKLSRVRTMPIPPVTAARRRFAMTPHRVPARKIVNENPGTTSWAVAKTFPGTKSKLYGPAPVNKDLFQGLSGTRLAVVLHEIRDRFGNHDPVIRALADEGLNPGKGFADRKTPGSKVDKPAADVYTRIRDRLLEHATGRAGARTVERDHTSPDPDLRKRADQLARGYNWHRVAAGLILDQAVAKFITSIAKDHLKGRNEHLRAAHNLFGIGSEDRAGGDPRKAKSREAFHAAMRDYLGKEASKLGLVAGDIKEQMILRSMRRVAQAEQNIHGKPDTVGVMIGTHGGLKHATPTSKVTANDPAAPAWTGKLSTPIGGGVKVSPRVSPRARAGQYARARAYIKRSGN
jgi:uncharacterized protein (TIGR02996 family)